MPFPLLAQTGSYTVKTVVIDPGHGGKDPGAVSKDPGAEGRMSKEKDIALSIALKLGGYIQDKCKGVKVVYTRKTDVFVPLDRRAEIANAAGADLFISVHINSSTNKDAYGTNTYIYGVNYSEDEDETVALENSVVKYEDNASEKYSGWMLADDSEMTTYGGGESILMSDGAGLLAAKIQQEFESRARRRNRGVGRARFLVLKNTKMPAVLVECGFISNDDERKFLVSDYGQSIVASAIYRAFKAFSAGDEPASVNDEGICFRVQVLSSSNKVSIADTPELQGIGEVAELFSDGKYKYVVGRDTDYNRIKQYQKTISRQVPGAFVIAVQNGRIIEVSKAKQLLGQ